jgi:hypothetical protein
MPQEVIMKANDIITIILAAYAAILSTILGISELRKGKRRLTIGLEYIPVDKRVNLRLVNSGTRPITIVGISLTLCGEKFYIVPGELMMANNEYSENLPVTLNDGTQTVFRLSDLVASRLIEKHDVAFVEVEDAEGKKHRAYKKVARHTLLEILPRKSINDLD